MCAKARRPRSRGEEEGEAEGQAPCQRPRLDPAAAGWVRVGGVGRARGRGAEKRAQRAQPDLGRSRIRARGPKRRREGPGTPTVCRPGGEAWENREREKGQEVPYRHRATLPPHPLRSRRSAPTLGARPRRPTWPPRAQLKGCGQQPPPTSSPASLPEGARGAQTRRRANEESARLKVTGRIRGGRAGGKEVSVTGTPAQAQQQPSGAVSLGGFASAAATAWA